MYTSKELKSKMNFVYLYNENLIHLKIIFNNLKLLSLALERIYFTITTVFNLECYITLMIYYKSYACNICCKIY